jgi:flagellar motor switch protein FliM
MNDILSAAEIDALFDQASQGRPPSEQGDAGHGRRARWLRTVDFTRPSKFGIDQQRRLRRIMEVFCATASTRLSAEHRIDLNLEVIDAGQFTFANALQSVPEASVAAVVETTGETKLLMTAELVLVLEVIERLLGGTGDGVAERQLTDIERVLARRLFGAFVECLSTTWHDVCGANLELGRVDPLGEGPQIVPASEPTLVLTVEARRARRSTTRALVVPQSLIHIRRCRRS